MTAQQKAVFTIVYFLVMLIPSYLSRRWLWAAVCKAGGTTPKELRAKIGKAEEKAQMDEDFKEVQEKFQGLDMKTVIGDPLRAASEAEMMLASATAEFLREPSGVKKNTNKNAKVSENNQ